MPSSNAVTTPSPSGAAMMVDDDIDLGNIEDILRVAAEEEEASLGASGIASGSPFSNHSHSMNGGGGGAAHNQGGNDYHSTFSATSGGDKPFSSTVGGENNSTGGAAAGGGGRSAWSGFSDGGSSSKPSVTSTTTTTTAGKSGMQASSKPFFPSTTPVWSASNTAAASTSAAGGAASSPLNNSNTYVSARNYTNTSTTSSTGGGGGGSSYYRDPTSGDAGGRPHWYAGNTSSASAGNGGGGGYSISQNTSISSARGGGYPTSGGRPIGNGGSMNSSAHGGGGGSHHNSIMGTPISRRDILHPNNNNNNGGNNNPNNNGLGGLGQQHCAASVFRDPIPYETYLPFEGIKPWVAEYYCVVVNNLEPKTTTRHLNAMFFPLGAVDAVAFAMPIGEEDTFRMYQGRKGGIAMFSTAEIAQMAAEKIDDFVPNGQTQPLRTFYFGRYEDYAKKGKNAFYVRIRENLNTKNPDLWRNIDILCVTFQEAIGFSEEEATDAGLLLMEVVERDPERYFSIAVHICRVVSGVPLKHSSAFFTAVSRGVIQRGVTGKGASLMFREASAVLCALLFDLKVLKGGTPFPMANKLCKDLTAKAAKLRERELQNVAAAGGGSVSANRGLSLGSTHSDHMLCALVAMCSNWAVRNPGRETHAPEELEFRDQVRQIARAGFGGPQILQYTEDALSDTQRRYRCGWETAELSESSSEDEDEYMSTTSSDSEDVDYLDGDGGGHSDDDLPLAAMEDFYNQEYQDRHHRHQQQHHHSNSGSGTNDSGSMSGQSTPRRDRAAVRSAGFAANPHPSHQHHNHHQHHHHHPSSPAAVTPNTSIDASYSQTPEKRGFNTSCDSGTSFSVSAGSHPTPIKTPTSNHMNTSTASHHIVQPLHTNPNGPSYATAAYPHYHHSHHPNTTASTSVYDGQQDQPLGGGAERLSSILNRTVYMTKVPVHLPNAVLRRVFMTFGELSKVRVYDGERSLSHEGAKYTGGLNNTNSTMPPPSPSATTAQNNNSSTSHNNSSANNNGDGFSVSSGTLNGAGSGALNASTNSGAGGGAATQSNNSSSGYPPFFVSGTNVPLAVTRGSFGFVEFASSTSAKAMVDFFRNPTAAVCKSFALGDDAEKAVLLMRVSFARSAIHDNEPHDAVFAPISAKRFRKQQKAAAAAAVAAAPGNANNTTGGNSAGTGNASGRPLPGGGTTTNNNSSGSSAPSSPLGGTGESSSSAADSGALQRAAMKRVKKCAFGLGGIY